MLERQLRGGRKSRLVSDLVFCILKRYHPEFNAGLDKIDMSISVGANKFNRSALLVKPLPSLRVTDADTSIYQPYMIRSTAMPPSITSRDRNACEPGV